MPVGVFAGIPVRDYTSAVEWYKRLLGSEPTFTRTMSRRFGIWPRTGTCTSSKHLNGQAARSA